MIRNYEVQILYSTDKGFITDDTFDNRRDATRLARQLAKQFPQGSVRIKTITIETIRM